MNTLPAKPGSGPANVERERPRHRGISRKLSAGLDALVHGARTITDAAESAGMRREALSLALRKPHVQEELDRRVRDAMKRRGVKALANIEFLGDMAKSEYVRLEASKDLANRAGYIPPKEQPSSDGVLIVNIDLGDGRGPFVLHDGPQDGSGNHGPRLEGRVSP